jgi:hypothetical protein
MGAVAADLGRLRAGLTAWSRDAAQAAADAYLAAERRSLAAVAPGGRLRGLPRAGPLGAATRPAAPHRTGGAVVQVVPSGPLWAVEFPRRAGYPIPRRFRPGRRTAKVLRFGGRYAAHVAGGAITRPRRPWAAGAAAGRQPAIVAARAEYDALLHRTLTGGGRRV